MLHWSAVFRYNAAVIDLDVQQVFQALFHVPQVREQLATMPLPVVDADTPIHSSCAFAPFVLTVA